MHRMVTRKASNDEEEKEEEEKNKTKKKIQQRQGVAEKGKCLEKIQILKIFKIGIQQDYLSLVYSSHGLERPQARRLESISR